MVVSFLVVVWFIFKECVWEGFWIYGWFFCIFIFVVIFVGFNMIGDVLEFFEGFNENVIVLFFFGVIFFV